MIVALLVFGAVAMPATGLIIRPDVRGARHGLEMFVDLGRFGWYGYVAVSVLVLALGLVGVARGRRLAIGAATALLVLTVVFGAGHVIVVTTGLFHGDGRPWLAAVAAVVGVAAVFALARCRARLRRYVLAQ